MICAVQFVLQLDFSIVNVALNTIQRELSMAPAELQWIVTGYALTFGSLLLAGGRLADLLGRRRLLVIGLVLFAVASLACGLARWPAMLIVARMVQGAAAALASPAALSLLTTASPEGQARNRALALWQASTAGGATTGIIAGGLLTQYLGWRAVFLVNPPLIALLLAFVPRLPAGTATGGGKVGIRGAALVTGAIAALIYGLTEGQQHGFGSPASVAALVAAVVLALAFIYSERTLPAPMIPPSLLAAPARRAAIAAMLLIGATLAGYVYFLSLYLQKVHHFSPVQTGLGLLPSTLTVVLMSTLVTRRLLTRFGARQRVPARKLPALAAQPHPRRETVRKYRYDTVTANPLRNRSRRGNTWHGRPARGRENAYPNPVSRCAGGVPRWEIDAHLAGSPVSTGGDVGRVGDEFRVVL